MKRNVRSLLAIAAGGFVVVSVGIVPSAVAVSPASRTDWAPTASQVSRAAQMMLAMGTSSLDETQRKAQSTDRWPANFESVRIFGTDRPTELNAIDSPGAGTGDNRLVVCSEAKGTFSNAADPRPRGTSATTFPYAMVCVDAGTGSVVDWGYDNHPMNMQPTGTQQMDMSRPVG